MFKKFFIKMQQITPEGNNTKIQVLEGKLNLLIGIHGIELIAIITGIVALT